MIVIKCDVKLMTVLLVLLCCTKVILAGTSGASQGHCCQNELCPVDCVRCDGKATCYDLSDELGCSNVTDKKLLAYEKPPVFVPIILAVLKAQLRREKVELGYRFPDRNCFATDPTGTAQSDKHTYAVSQDAKAGQVTTEAPVWVQLLLKLRDAFGVPTTTTTQMPVWKRLLDKLKSEKDGVPYTTSATIKSWTEKVTPTPLPPVSQTPPWRKTGRPPTTQVPKRVTMQSSVDFTPEQELTSAKTVAIGIPVAITTQSSVDFTHEQELTSNKTVVIGIPVAITTESTANIDLTTEEPLPSSSTKADLTRIPVTIKETVFFIPPEQSASSTTILPDTSTEQTTADQATTSVTMPSTQTDSSTESLATTSTLEIASTSKIKTTGTLENTTLSTSTDYSNETVATEAAVGTTSIGSSTQAHIDHSQTLDGNITEASLPSTKASNMIITDVTGITLSSTISFTTETTPTTNVTSPLEILLISNSTETEITTYNQTTNDFVNARDIAAVDSLVERLNRTNTNISESFSATTELPFLATVDSLDVTMSTEFVRTVTESETPSPVQQKIISNPFKELSETSNPAIKEALNITNDLDKFNTIANTNNLGGQLVNLPVEANTSKILSNTGELQSNFNFTDPYGIYQFRNLSDINNELDGSATSDGNSYSSINSDKLRDSDFSYSNVDIPSQEVVNSTVKYSMQGTGITGFDLYNNTYQRDNLKSFNSSEKSNSFTVSVDNLSKTGNSLKNRLGSSATTLSPENEVRIMLGKLKALVSENLGSSAFQSLPTLREFNQTEPGTIGVQQIVTVTPPPATPSQVTVPTTRGHIMQEPAGSHVTQTFHTPPATPLPWWGQTTLSPFSFDNLLGFTTPPPFDQNWLYPATSSWDALFGVGGVPISQVSTVPPYSANQDRLNNIYDPLIGEIQPTTYSPPIIGNANLPTATNNLANGHNTQIGGFREAPAPTEQSVANGYNSITSSATTKPEYLQPATQRSMSVNIFNAQVDSFSPGNFSISELHGHNSADSNGYDIPIVNSKPNGHIDATVSSFVGRIPSETVTFSPITFPFVKQLNNDSFVDNSVSNVGTIKTSLKDGNVNLLTATNNFANGQKAQTVGFRDAPAPTYTPVIVPVTTPATITVSNTEPYRSIISIAHQPSNKPDSQSFTKVVSNLWDPSTQATQRQATEPFPVTSPVPQINPTTGVPVWDYGSNRVLSTDVISSWWSQMQPTTPAPAYVAPPTPTPMPTGEQCYEVQDLSGFCQTRFHGNYKNPTDCRSFYVCIWGFLHICKCPQSTVFDDTLNVCNWDYQVTCTTQT